jgi:hypothetical protein
MEKNTILDETRTGKADSAASTALRHKRLPKRRPFVTILILSVFISAGFISSLWYFKENSGKAESKVYIEQVHRIAALATAEAHVKVVLHEEDSEIFGVKNNWNLPGTKRELLMVVPATVIAGVDLQAIQQKDLKVDEEQKVIELVLPKASFLQEPSINMDQVKVISNEGILRGKIELDEGFDLAAKAQEQIKQEAVDSGILKKADENAETVLKEFFGQMGYNVIVKRS